MQPHVLPSGLQVVPSSVHEVFKWCQSVTIHVDIYLIWHIWPVPRLVAHVTRFVQWVPLILMQWLEYQYISCCYWGPVQYDKVLAWVPLLSRDVTKNLTVHWMHVEGPQIFQINRQINSFQNMYVEVFNQAACFEWKTHNSAMVSSKTFSFPSRHCSA